MERFIGETLRSVAAQTHEDYEVIVIDDGSTDRTMEVVREVAGQGGLRNLRTIAGEQRGVSAARNAGLQQAAGEYVVFLDGDDLLERTALERFEAALSGNRAPAALGRIQRVDLAGRAMPSPDNRSLMPQRHQLEALLRKNFVVNGGALAIRTENAAAAGGYDTGLRYGEDWEFWCRLALQGDFAVVDGAPVLSYRQVPSGANVQAQGSAFALSLPCLQRILQNPAMRDRYGLRLHWLIRQRQIDIFWSGVRGQLQLGNRFRGIATGLLGMMLYPDTILRPKLALRFMRSLDRR